MSGGLRLVPLDEVAKLSDAERLREVFGVSDSAQIVHIKGFGNGIDFTSEFNSSARAEALKVIESVDAKTIVWDGDDFNQTGFTSLVPLCAASGIERRFVAFRRDDGASVKALQASWNEFAGSTRLPVTVVLVPHDVGVDGLSSLDAESPLFWAQLGLVAIKCSGSQRSLCLGGGDTVVQEALLSPTVKFDVWCVKRRNINTSAIQLTAFESMDKLPPNVTLYNGSHPRSCRFGESVC